MFLLLMACNSGDDVSVDDSDSPDTSVPSVTFYRDVKPIVDMHCVRCHNSSGLGDGDFTNVEAVADLAGLMLNAIDEGRMPPPVSDPECRDYEGSDHMRVDSDERQVLADWIDEGKPMGNPEDDPGLTPPSGELADPDLVLSIKGDGYTPTYSDTANPGNEYRCFVLDPELTETRYVTAMAPVVDEAEIVHHVVLLAAGRDQVDESQMGADGYDCIDGPGGLADQMVGAWAPGMLPVTFPEGYGMSIGPDDIMVLQMHYFDNGSGDGPKTDASGYAFKTVDSVDTEIILAPVGIYDFSIPPNEEKHTEGGSFTNDYPVTLELRAAFPHMHVLGTGYDMRVQHGDGSETCLATGSYDFDNQLTYQWLEPVDLAPGDSIDFSCTWNNSTSNPDLGWEPKTTGYGERTDEEMCFFFTFVNLK